MTGTVGNLDVLMKTLFPQTWGRSDSEAVNINALLLLFMDPFFDLTCETCESANSRNELC